MRPARITSNIIQVSDRIVDLVLRLNLLLIKGDGFHRPAIQQEVLGILSELFQGMYAHGVKHANIIDISNTRVNNITFYFNHQLKEKDYIKTYPFIIYIEVDCVPLGLKWTLRLATT